VSRRNSGGLGAIANQMSDNQFAERMVNARSKPFQRSFNKSQGLPTELPDIIPFSLIFQLEWTVLQLSSLCRSLGTAFKILCTRQTNVHACLIQSPEAKCAKI